MMRALLVPATRNRTRDDLMAANFYSQMLYQLSYSRLEWCLTTQHHYRRAYELLLIHHWSHPHRRQEMHAQIRAFNQLINLQHAWWPPGHKQERVSRTTFGHSAMAFSLHTLRRTCSAPRHDARNARSGHPESNQGQSDGCKFLQSDALPTEL